MKTWRINPPSYLQISPWATGKTPPNSNEERQNKKGRKIVYEGGLVESVFLHT